MSDYKKIRMIHDIKENFINIDEKYIEVLTNQIENSNFKDNIERFYKGYKIEDYFSYLFSALPWIKLLHGLEETQLPSISKEHFQVPDYLLLYESTDLKNHPIIIDVKSVKSEKVTLDNVMKKQYDNIKRYSEVINIPFLYAIYWEKYHIWTINSILNFQEKPKKYKLSFEEAFKNDISLIFGDISYIVKKPIFRKTSCDSSITSDEYSKHEKYGAIISDEISNDKEQWIKIEAFESAIIDSTINMKIEKIENSGEKTVLIEKSDNPYIIKLSSLIIRHLSLFDMDLKPDSAQVSGNYIIQFMKKINIVKSYFLANDRNDDTDFFYKQAFEKSHVYESYMKYHEKNSE